MELRTYVTPTQYVVVWVQHPNGGWDDVGDVVVSATDNINGEVFTSTVAVETRKGCAVRIGPFRKGAAFTVTVTTRDAGAVTLETDTAEVTITNNNSPGVIIRQAIFDALLAADLEGVELLNDGLFRPAIAAEDMPYTDGNVVVQIGAPSSTKQKKTPVRSHVPCKIPLTVIVFGEDRPLDVCDNTAWAVQKAVDGSANLRIGCLGLNNFAWEWDVGTPDVPEIEGNTAPVAVQELTFQGVALFVTEPAS